MPSSVIQGSFPHGLNRIPGAARQPHAPAVQLPPHLAAFPLAGGQPLPDNVRQRMESFFGARFSDVRVHQSTHAQSLGANAFTHGSHIHFAPNQYNLQSTQGQHLLTHELAHVVQQRTGRVRNPFGNGVAVVQNMQLEAEAERLAQRAGTQGVLQRLVVLLSDDELTRTTYGNLIAPNQDSFRAIPEGAQNLFGSLGRNETLHLIVHGGGGEVDGMNARAFVRYLMRNGLDPNAHRGGIHLVSCYSGSDDGNGSTFVAQLALELRREGFVNAVQGYNGLVRVDRNQQVRVIPPEKAGLFWTLRSKMAELKSEFRALDLRKPTLNTDELEKELFQLELDDWKERWKKYVTDGLEKLWTRYSTNAHTVYIPQAPLSSRHTANDEWEEWMTEKMRAYNLIRHGQSIRPRNDYSSSYIS